jgi:hypothetical protein
MKLFEHADFDQAILRAESHFKSQGLRAAIIEKDYYVTEAIHGKVQLLKRDGQPLGTYARHYYDLFQLAIQPEVLAMLQSEEYQAIKKDYDRVSREYFPKSYFYPEALRFAASEALFPSEHLARQIAVEYEGPMPDALLRTIPFMARGPGSFPGIARTSVKDSVRRVC